MQTLVLSSSPASCHPCKVVDAHVYAGWSSPNSPALSRAEAMCFSSRSWASSPTASEHAMASSTSNPSTVLSCVANRSDPKQPSRRLVFLPRPPGLTDNEVVARRSATRCTLCVSSPPATRERRQDSSSAASRHSERNGSRRWASIAGVTAAAPSRPARSRISAAPGSTTYAAPACSDSLYVSGSIGTSPKTSCPSPRSGR